jgi:hypothetical protein
LPPPMKSAYELAMERLEKAAPTLKLSDAQRAEIAELEAVYKAKIAEKEVFLADEMAKARSKGEYGEAETMQVQLHSEVRRLQAECDEKKERVRRAS